VPVYQANFLNRHRFCASAGGLNLAVQFFTLHPSSAATGRRLGLASHLGFNHAFPDQFSQFIQATAAIGLLRALIRADHDDHAGCVKAIFGQVHQSVPGLVGQPVNERGIDSELGLGVYFINVLATRTA